MDAQNYKNVCPKVIDFCKFLKLREKYYDSFNFCLFVIVLYCTQRRCSQIKPQLKVGIEDVSKAKSLVYLYFILQFIFKIKFLLTKF